MKTGNQSPVYEKIGDYEYSYGEEVAEMFTEDGGATFYPSQLYELKLMLARKRDGSPAAMSLGISKPRQNGKSYAARYYAVYMAVFEHRDVLYSAHHGTTTSKMFKALCDLFENSSRFPEFAKDVKRVSHARGYEGFYFNDWIDSDGLLKKGGCIEFVTRTKSGQRGGTYSVVIIDEAQELTDEQQENMLPTISASSDIKNSSMMPQQIFIGTPPGPSCYGTVFADMRNKAHSKEKTAIWWLEWSIESNNIEEDVNCKAKAIELAYLTNPAIGYRIAEKTIENEYETMSVDGFARERLGWWMPAIEEKTDYAITASDWDACKSSEPKPEGKTAYGVKFSIDGSMVCLCGAVLPSEGPARVSLIDCKPTGHGTRWLSEWLCERYNKASCVVIDGRNGVDVLIDRLQDVWKFKGSIIRPTTRDVLAAVSTLTDAVNEQSITWFEGQELLRDSAVTSVRRPIGGGWGFGGDNSAPIEAASLALWGVKTSKRDPSRKMRIG